ncbi:Helix-turn-helix domain protein [Thalassovita gelatinovora]|uniref:Helix-turn-helix domain protein n=1 Tax=Thalassovita gelatinovora TaxID=53501 RepID=A0A0P1FF21_THAGE|nr:RodZ domain-containing protein [Thalassovita gelatinovora]QIZ79693.1 DUF4115 domain-containing protein [Thalassovita gelatinovora]CUH66675.1 Helix-turn-helix domain protein [Thalassovita gelatinovora]SEQ40428.1 protein RodZ, contains Xre-like HTH and DUF4115 domains [Thalassovita gelatinovora]
MIRRKRPKVSDVAVAGPKGFDDFEMRLGDVMRGERATLGKSLLDVQRELRIKAAYIAAIENADPSVFDTPGFIAGYVRSYARYLGMDPEEAFDRFCEESGFSTAHGMSAEASSRKAAKEVPLAAMGGRDPFNAPTTPFAPVKEGFFANIEPGAIGSSLVLLALIGGIGYGGWTVLNEIQRVQFAPVENTPDVLADLDPLATTRSSTVAGGVAQSGAFTPPAEALDRLYRPQALDVPVLVARDAPISTLDPSSVGSFVPATPDQFDTAFADPEPAAQPIPDLPQVVERLGDGVTIVAARPSWVRVQSADGTSVFEGIMEPCDTYTVAQTEQPHTIRVGDSGSIYFAVDGTTRGPAGSRGSVTSKLALSIDHLNATYQVADFDADRDIAKIVADLRGESPEPFCQNLD